MMTSFESELDDEAIALLLAQARRYRSLAAKTSEIAVAAELEHLAALFEAEASRGSDHPITLH